MNENQLIADYLANGGTVQTLDDNASCGFTAADWKDAISDRTFERVKRANKRTLDARDRTREDDADARFLRVAR